MGLPTASVSSACGTSSQASWIARDTDKQFSGKEIRLQNLERAENVQWKDLSARRPLLLVLVALPRQRPAITFGATGALLPHLCC